MNHSTGFILTAFMFCLLLGMSGCAGPKYERGMKFFTPENPAAAVRTILPLAEQGNADAQFNLGSLYYQGWGVPHDYAEALKWFRRAAEQNHVSAQVNLGTLYAEGLAGVIAKDYAQALMWYILAAAGGDAEAIQLRDNLMVKMTPSQIAAGQKLAREFKPEDQFSRILKEQMTLAQKGDAQAQLRVGVMYYFGQGVPQDFREAIVWFKKSAQGGNPFAQANVGYMYEKGEGRPQDFAEASRWYRMAAERGNAPAQLALGIMYERGNGVNQDEVQALKWYILAAAQGDSAAKAARDRMAVWMTPAQIAEAQRQAREFKVIGK